MAGTSHPASHSAEAAALGFYYQAFFALLTLLEQQTDDAAVAVEQLDDVELRVDGQTLLFQLKHSIRSEPSPVTLKSRSLWGTLKVWIDALPTLSLSETTFHLVAVAAIASTSPLLVLTSPGADRAGLTKAMADEARRVTSARAEAAKKNLLAGKNDELPYADRCDGCEAFLSLSDAGQQSLLRRIIIKQDSPPIGKIEELVSEHLGIVPPKFRPAVAQRLVEWWDRQVVYSLCNKRSRAIARTELQQQISAIIGDLEHDRLLADFEAISHPESYQPDGMLARQIQLVNGRSLDLAKAIREEWRARQQRGKWISERPNMAAVIGQHDQVLKEHWADRHGQMVDDNCYSTEEEKCAAGLRLLRWSHNEAPSVVRPIVPGWSAAYYVRGSYQVLAIDLDVGWHPSYRVLLGDDK